MTSHRIFVLFIATFFVVLGIGMMILGVNIFLESPILGEDGRMAGILLALLGIGSLGLAASGIKMNFFTKDEHNTDPRSTT